MLSNNLLVFPTSRAIREYVSLQKDQNGFLDKYISIGDFFQRVVREKNNRVFCDKNLKILFLKEAIKEVDITSLGLSLEFSTFINQSEYIFRFFGELSSEYVELENLLEFDTYSLYEEHILILKQIYQKYIQILAEHNYTDNITLPYNYILNSDYIENFSSITLIQEGYLTKFEYRIIDEISKIIDLQIDISINDYNKKNLTIFEEFDLEVGFRYKLDFSNRSIISKEPLINRNKKVLLSPIGSQIEQVAFIKYQIVKMIEYGIDANSIAVLVPNENIASILQMFDDEHYFNFAMGRDIKNSKIVKVVSFISKVIVDYDPSDEDKFSFFKIDKDIFTNLFENNWNKELSRDIFDNVLDYLFGFEDNIHLVEKLDNLRLYLRVLFFGKFSFSIKLKEFIKVLQKELNKIVLDDISGGKVTVLGILETRNISYDGIIVVDFNDDNIPKLSVKDKFISSSLKDHVGLPSFDDRQDLQKYYYKQFLDSARYVAMCYVDDETKVLSRFVTQLFPNYKEYIEYKNYSDILYTKHSINHFYKEISLDIDLSKLEWSATSLKVYLECKRKFYFKYIVNIKEHSYSLKPQSYELGTIIHDALEEAVRKKSLNKTFVLNYLANYSKKNPFLSVELELWSKRLDKFFAMQNSRDNMGISIVDVEKPFKFKYKDIVIKGKIDRIDKYQDGIYEIIDYKTSSSLKVDTIKTVEDSIDFQLEFYYLASRDKNVGYISYFDLYNGKIEQEILLDKKLELLDSYLASLKTDHVNFILTEDIKRCQFCSYKTICNR